MDNRYNPQLFAGRVEDIRVTQHMFACTEEIFTYKSVFKTVNSKKYYFIILAYDLLGVLFCRSTKQIDVNFLNFCLIQTNQWARQNMFQRKVGIETRGCIPINSVAVSECGGRLGEITLNKPNVVFH